ncbi:MAG: glycosyltransferase [Acetobacteraceae bacterium]
MTLDVSVVISAKNRSVLLWDCFQGLAAQTIGKDRFEVVLIDNVSSEDLGAVAERARGELGLSIRTARTERDRGPAPARNLGVTMAAAPIIAFTDSDCRPHPEWLAIGVAVFADPAIALATGPVQPKPGQQATLTSKLTFKTDAEHPTFPTANAFYRRAVFLGFGGFDASLSFRDPFDRATECADTDLAWRIIEAGHARRFLPNALVYHEIEDQGLMMWLLEPTRLFVLPELVRRHPVLRRELLTAGVFFYPQSWLIYVGMVVGIVALVMWPWLLLLLPVLLLARGIMRTGSVDPVGLLRFTARTLIHMPRMMLMNLCLLYGSVRFRCLVL